MNIACDIGGVLRNLSTGLPIADAIDTILELNETNKVILISKCGPCFIAKITAWLEEYGLSSLPIFYCENYEDKVRIAAEQGVQVIIDDKIQVLRHFPGTVLKIWFCEEEQKIQGTMKHQPEFVASLKLARFWIEIPSILEDY